MTLFFTKKIEKNDDGDQHVSLENCQYQELLKDLEWDVSLIGRDLTAGRGGEQLCFWSCWNIDDDDNDQGDDDDKAGGIGWTSKLSDRVVSLRSEYFTDLPA